MTKTHSTKRSLVAAALVLCLCLSTFIGTTFAWFTDSATSANNKIVAGTLKIDLEVLDKTSGVWKSIKGNHDPIFNYDKWEPGYVDAKILKVENDGTLALKWKAKFVADEELSILADVVDVYVLPYGVLTDASSVAYPASRDLEAEGYTRVGTVREFVNTIEQTTHGVLKEGEVAYLGIALKMQESAGNEYQEKSIGAFDIQVVAAQLASENDSFGNPNYDENAQFPGEIGSAEELVAALSRNENVKLTKDIDLAGMAWTPIANYSGVLDGNGYAIKNLTGANGLFAKISGATIKNLDLENVNITATDNRVGAIAGQIDKVAGAPVTVIDNVTVSGTVAGANYYTGGFVGADRSFNTVISNSTNNATVTGKQQVGGFIGQANRLTVVDNCTNNGSVTAETIMAGGIIGLIAGDDNNTDLRVTVKNCTNNGQVKQTNPFSGLYLEGGVAGAVGRDGGDQIKNVITAYISNCTVLAGEKLYGGKYNYASGKDEKIVVVNLVEVATADELVAAFANLKAGDTISIVADIDMSGKTLAAVQGNVGFTMLGNDNVISNLASTDSALFVAHSGSSAYVFENVILENCSVNSANNYGALFVGDADTSDEITIKNCVVNNCTVKSAKYAALFVAYTAGYDVQNNGPVYSDVLVENCTAVGGSVIGGGSTAVAVGHAGGNVDTTTTVSNLTVENVYIEGEDEAHTGIAVGTAHVGETVINNVSYATVSGNYNASEKLFGRFVPNSTGTLTIDGMQCVNSSAALKAAVAAGATNIYLVAGNYTVDNCGGKVLTLTGSRAAVLKPINEGEDGCDYGFGGNGAGVGTVTFNGLTIDTTSNTGTYKGYAYMGGTYNNCAFVGGYTLHRDSYFYNCEFNFKNNYVWTWGAANVVFEGCTFEDENGVGKAILVHNTTSTVVTVKDCTFIATTTAKTWDQIPVAAVSIDPTNAVHTATVYFEGTNTYSDAFHGLYQLKYNAEASSVTVYVDGTSVSVPVGENDK